MRDLATVVIAESVLLTLCGGIVGALISPLIAAPLMDKINSAWFHVAYDLGISNFLLVVGPALVLAILVGWQTSRRIGRLDISQAVRTRLAG
jgi:ABC-type antimicrobial peptide transport system permease subunit